MNLNYLLDKVKNSDEFKKLDKSNYLVNYVFMDYHWGLGFYSKETRKITSFIVNDKIKIIPENEVLQKENAHLEELDLNLIKINLDEALEIAIKEKNNNEDISKKIIILQKIKEQLWNITFITSLFNLFNIKINAENGKILNQNMESLLRFK